jgi:hypothetical protein
MSWWQKVCNLCRNIRAVERNVRRRAPVLGIAKDQEWYGLALSERILDS